MENKEYGELNVFQQITAIVLSSFFAFIVARILQKHAARIFK